MRQVYFQNFPDEIQSRYKDHQCLQITHINYHNKMFPVVRVSMLQSFLGRCQVNFESQSVTSLLAVIVFLLLFLKMVPIFSAAHCDI